SSTMAGAVLQSLDLEVVAMHCDLPLGPALPPLLNMATALSCGRIIWHGWPRSPEHDSIGGVRRLAACYNDAHAAAADHGLKFGLHNHWWEFEPVNGAYPYRVFDEVLHPDAFLEIDTYWVQTAHLDPAAVIAELGSRVRLLHLKDGPAVHGYPMTALGQGVLDFPRILSVIPHAVDWVVELDECASDIFQAIDLSLRYLHSNAAPGLH
ncbi:MAG: TIM barrel protein, partial [Verrucomicrobiales bacterium]|nr:TIM barrel protein [Verrucomicrobiales bacterium]